MKLSGRVALVTGASRGIGKQIALALAGQGADIVVAARTVEARKRLPGTIGETVGCIEALGRKALAVATDVTKPDDIERLITTAHRELGRIDILVNNAAFTAGKSWGAALEDLPFEEWQAQYATNIHAPFLTMQRVVPIMKAQGGGVIINLSSGAGDLQDPDAVDLSQADLAVTGNPPLAYSSTKAAVNRLSNVIAPSLRQHNITVVAMDPGFVRTEMVDLMVEAGMDATRSIPMSIPADAVVKITTSPDPLQYSGRILRAAEVVAS